MKTHLRITLFSVCAMLIFAACSSQEKLAAPPVITSASRQHTLYNGKSQPIEARAAKVDAPLAVTYYATEADYEAERNGKAEPPAEVGVYYARIRRPAGNGYKQGQDVKVEYHIQKPLPPAQFPAESLE
jgi:hypothetical protein